MGNYMVLMANEGSFIPVGEYDAVNTIAAIKQAIGTANRDTVAGEFVAVPTRSWQPVKVQAQVQVRLSVEKPEAVAE